MQAEDHAPTRSATPAFVPNLSIQTPQAGMSYEPLPWVTTGKESLAASSSARFLQKALMYLGIEYRPQSAADAVGITSNTPLILGVGDLPRIGQKEPLAASSSARFLEKALMGLGIEHRPQSAAGAVGITSNTPLILGVGDLSLFRQVEVQQSSVATQEQTRLVNKLHGAFDAEPVESCVTHPAEAILTEALQSLENYAVLDWLKEVFLDAEHPSFAASVMRCLGRLAEPGTEFWRAELVRNGLAMDDLSLIHI